MHAHDAMHLLACVCLLGRRPECTIIAVIVRVPSRDWCLEKTKVPLSPPDAMAITDAMILFLVPIRTHNCALHMNWSMGCYVRSSAISSSQQAALQYPDNHGDAMMLHQTRLVELVDVDCIVHRCSKAWACWAP